jgi:hypothetical protein
MAKLVDSITGIERKSESFGVPIPVRIKKTTADPKIISEYKPLLQRIGLKLACQFLAGLVLAVGLSAAGVRNPTIAQGIDLYRLVEDGKYLILFQNNTELRPTGGFIGSFAIAEIKHKRLADFKIETNLYHKDDQFIKDFYIPQPKPFEDWLPGKSWSLHDSNWEADFKKACQDIKWFYETEYQDQVNGIIAINATVLSDILGLTGPVELADYQMTLDQDNVLEQLQRQIDLDYYKTVQGLIEDQPKAILADLWPILRKEIEEMGKLKFAKLIKQKLRQKDILFCFEDNRQEIVEQNQWGGRIDRNSPNFLHINNANLGGGKSSLSTKQEVNYQLDQDELTLIITRTNLPREDGFPTHTNFNYTRIYLPKGSQLISGWMDDEKLKVIDKEIEFNRSVYGFWFNTPLHESRTVQLIFRLPASAAQGNLMIQKQPGVKNETISVMIDGEEIFRGGLMEDIIFGSRL